MNILTITQSNKCFIVEFESTMNDYHAKLYCLNQQSLVWHLKKKVGLRITAVASIIHMLEYQSQVRIDLSNTERKVS